MKQLPPPDNRLPAPIQNDYADPTANDLPSGGLLEYWRILQRRKGTVILIAGLGMIAGFLYTVPQTPIY